MSQANPTESALNIDAGTSNAFVPDIERVHRDLAFANEYRLEFIKHTVTISAALLAFTVSFRPTLAKVEASWLVWPGWIGLGLAIIGGLGCMRGWELFYATFRDYDHENRRELGRARRKVITFLRRVALTVLIVGFVVGVLCIAAFAAANINNVQHENMGL